MISVKNKWPIKKSYSLLYGGRLENIEVFVCESKIERHKQKQKLHFSTLSKPRDQNRKRTTCLKLWTRLGSDHATLFVKTVPFKGGKSY